MKNPQKTKQHMHLMARLTCDGTVDDDSIQFSRRVIKTNCSLLENEGKHKYKNGKKSSKKITIRTLLHSFLCAVQTPTNLLGGVRIISSPSNR